MFLKCYPHVSYSYICLGELLLRNIGFVLGEIRQDFVFADHAVSKHFLCIDDIPSCPCEVQDEVCFEIIGITDRL
jgi:hypothetical protein